MPLAMPKTVPCSASVHEVNLGASAGADMRDLGFLKIRLDPI